MTPAQLEIWAQQIVERVLGGARVEDSRVELKSDWPTDHHRAARQIAGLLNASRGAGCLWLAGLDEQAKCLTTLSAIEPAAWWDQVASHFEALAPEPLLITVPTEQGLVVAALFDNPRPPYVVKNPSGGAPEFEVPWRSATRLRAANRAELLRLLVPTTRLPAIELLEASFSVILRVDSRGSAHLRVEFYIVPPTIERIVIPFHTAQAVLYESVPESPILRISPLPLEVEYRWDRSASGDSRRQVDSRTVDFTDNELVVDGPGAFRVDHHFRADPTAFSAVSGTLRVAVSLKPAGSEDECQLTFSLTPSQHGPEALMWTRERAT